MNALLGAAQWIDLIATTALAGGIISATLVGPVSPRGRRVLRSAAMVLAATLAFELGLTTVRLGAVAAVGGIALVRSVLQTRWGLLWMARSTGLAILIGTRSNSPWLAAFTALWLLTRSFQGHAGAHGVLPAVIDWVHLLAAVTWVGGLMQFALATASGDAAERARRLRAVGTGALLLLVPAGIYGALLHVRPPSALLTTPYGRTLSVKLVLASVLIGLGAACHFIYVPALWRGQFRAARTLARIVRLEVAIGLLVLLLTAILSILPPPPTSSP